jgi:lantibiotic modifying enzyme
MPGILWALYNTGNYLNDEELISAANKGLALLSHESPENDEALDIIGGAAGGALTLAAFYGALGEERLLEFIKSCAERLINKRFQYDKWKLWPSTHAFKPLTGFAHGASGCALALAKAYELARVDIFKEAALEAVDYEASAYISLNNNWPDFRHNRDLKPGETAFMAGWCSGAPGIGLARIKMPPEFHNRQVKDDIENALNFTLEFAQSGQFRDHLCCGNAGHIDFLIESAIELNRPQLIEEAKKRFSFVINRSGLNGSYTLPVDESKSIFTPGLFTGLAGIGLTALRLIDPKLIRSVLAPGANGPNI